MAKPQSGDKVRVHYTGKLEDGSEFDSSRGGDPLEFTMGQNQMIPGFESAVSGLDIGETCKITLTPDQAYGVRDDELLKEVPRSMMPDGVELAEGLVLEGQSPDGDVTRFVIDSLSEDTVTLDANHPLAGKTLTFDIELAEIV